MKSQSLLTSFTPLSRQSLKQLKGGGTGQPAIGCDPGSSCFTRCSGYGCYCHPVAGHCVAQSVGGPK